MKAATCVEIVRLFQSFTLDIVRERASGFDGEIVELVDDLARELKIPKTEAAALLYRPYRAAQDALKGLQV